VQTVRRNRIVTRAERSLGLRRDEVRVDEMGSRVGRGLVELNAPGQLSERTRTSVGVGPSLLRHHTVICLKGHRRPRRSFKPQSPPANESSSASIASVSTSHSPMKRTFDPSNMNMSPQSHWNVGSNAIRPTLAPSLFPHTRVHPSTRMSSSSTWRYLLALMGSVRGRSTDQPLTSSG